MDGVGDYTRGLAAELNAQGHQCHLLALSDSHVREATACEFSDGPNVTMGLRLPATQSWPERVRRAKSFCESLAPDWVSWQIVLYGFDRRGMSFGLGRRFKEISGTCRNQIMFHEIWIGGAEQSTAKHKIVGKLQRSIIKDLLRRLHPLVIHTHAPLYRHLLGKLGFPVTILSLFGNVALAASPESEWLKKQGAGAWADRNAWWIFVMFGSIHPEWDAEDFWQRASEGAQKAGKKCLLIFIGRPGAAGERKMQELQEHQGDSWRFLNLGQRPEEDISQSLLAADFGVSSVPPENVFKSGTVAAMIEHGLQVIVTRPVARYADCPSEILTVGMRNVVRDFNLETLRKSKVGSSRPEVARQFIEDLERA
jgi:hypothetical protein